jgi:hypothetical protein
MPHRDGLSPTQIPVRWVVRLDASGNVQRSATAAKNSAAVMCPIAV